jgi:hypothetical protein
MKQLSSLQEKSIIEIENRWLKHKRLRNKPRNHQHPDFLTMKEREGLLDKLFFVIFND